jgi:hypothetical protein
MMDMTRGVASLCLGLLGGAIGASSTMLMQDHIKAGKTLQVRGLEIVDAQNNVRAVLATDESNGGVYLRMQSQANPAAILMQVTKDNGTLSFYTSHTNNLVAVGYQPVGDTVDDPLGAWGITIRGPNHQLKGLNVFTKDGVPQGFTLPLPPPSPTPLPPR